MNKLELYKKYKKEPTEKQLDELKHDCVICGERIAVMCGTPVVKWSGCCTGYQTPTKRVMQTRTAHTWCWIDFLQDKKIIKRLKNE